MIDHEDFYVDKVAKAIKQYYPNAEVVSEYVSKPSRFPHIYFREADNTTDTISVPIKGGEALARLMYSVDVFSNSQSERKQECKTIMGIIDSVMLKYYFQRTMCNPIPNLNDATIYRMVARYSKTESKTEV